jgi:hypothetical protein
MLHLHQAIEMRKIGSILDIQPPIGFIECPGSGDFLAENVLIGDNALCIVYRFVPGETEILVGKQGNRKVDDDKDEDCDMLFYN